MSSAEYKAMQQTGTVQEGAGGVTSVLHPPDHLLFQAQAKPGSLFVEFDVPASALKTGGKEGWSIIPGPGSVHARLAASKGAPIPQFPAAGNIAHTATKP
jgi:hypothetical protein